MQWLYDNKWLFDGVGAIIVVGVIGFLLKRYVFTEPAAIKNSLDARDSQVSGSPVVGGSGNVTNIWNYSQPPTAAAAAASPVAAIATEPERSRPNIQQTGSGVVNVTQLERGVWTEGVNIPSEENALVLQFTNNARPGSRNAGVLVKAQLVYRDDTNDVRTIIGGWVNESTDIAEFRVDESHKLVVGLSRSGFRELIAIERRRTKTEGGDRVQTLHHPLPETLQTVRVRLTNANTGEVLYEGRFQVTFNPPRIEFIGH